MIDEGELLDDFLNLVKIDSPSYREGPLADHLESEIQKLGLRTSRDDAGKAHGTTGNLIVEIPPSGEVGPGVPVLVFLAHMDTVRSSAGLRPVFENGIVRTDGSTILGADDKAGIAILLQAMKALVRNGLPHGPIYAAFTIAEETGLIGASKLELPVKPDFGFVLDSGGRPGTLVVETPSHKEFVAEVMGKPAHAGVEPERGINAIEIAAKAIAKLRWGRIDEQTTCNVGVISGGTATNIVPESARVKAEARSMDEARLEQVVADMRRSFEEAAREAGGRVEIKIIDSFKGYRFNSEDSIVRLAVEAVEAQGLEPDLVGRGGGSDANSLNQAGIPCLNLGVGINCDHSNEEHIALADMVNGCRLVLSIIAKTMEPGGNTGL